MSSAASGPQIPVVPKAPAIDHDYIVDKVCVLCSINLKTVKKVRQHLSSGKHGANLMSRGPDIPLPSDCAIKRRIHVRSLDAIPHTSTSSSDFFCALKAYFLQFGGIEVVQVGKDYAADILFLEPAGVDGAMSIHLHTISMRQMGTVQVSVSKDKHLKLSERDFESGQHIDCKDGAQGYGCAGKESNKHVESGRGGGRGDNRGGGRGGNRGGGRGDGWGDNRGGGRGDNRGGGRGGNPGGSRDGGSFPMNANDGGKQTPNPVGGTVSTPAKAPDSDKDWIVGRKCTLCKVEMDTDEVVLAHLAGRKHFESYSQNHIDVPYDIAAKRRLYTPPTHDNPCSRSKYCTALGAYFHQFGRVERIEVQKDMGAIVLFGEPDSVNQALEETQHYVIATDTATIKIEVHRSRHEYFDQILTFHSKDAGESVPVSRIPHSQGQGLAKGQVKDFEKIERSRQSYHGDLSGQIMSNCPSDATVYHAGGKLTNHSEKSVDVGHLMTQLHGCKDLSAQLMLAHEMTRLTTEEWKNRWGVANMLTSWLRRSNSKDFSRCQVELFGSSDNGLGKAGCDMDMVLLVNNPIVLSDNPFGDITWRRNEQIVLKKQSCALRVLGPLLCIRKARVPIIRLTVMGYNCDLSFNRRASILNTQLISQLGSVDSRIRPLISAVKSWCSIHLTPGKGGLTSYAACLLAIFYLQNTEPAMLPSVSSLSDMPGCKKTEYAKGRHGITFPADFMMHCSGNPLSVGELFEGFFQFYHSFDFANSVISTWLGRAIPISDPGITPNFVKGAMNVQDPYEHGHNTTSSIRPSALIQAKEELSYACQLLELYSDKSTSSWGLTKLLADTARIPRWQYHIHVEEKQSVSGCLVVLRLFQEVMFLSLSPVVDQTDPRVLKGFSTKDLLPGKRPLDADIGSDGNGEESKDGESPAAKHRKLTNKKAAGAAEAVTTLEMESDAVEGTEPTAVIHGKGGDADGMDLSVVDKDAMSGDGESNRKLSPNEETEDVSVDGHASPDEEQDATATKGSGEDILAVFKAVTTTPLTFRNRAARSRDPVFNMTAHPTFADHVSFSNALVELGQLEPVDPSAEVDQGISSFVCSLSYNKKDEKIIMEWTDCRGDKEFFTVLKELSNRFFIRTRLHIILRGK